MSDDDELRRRRFIRGIYVNAKPGFEASRVATFDSWLSAHDAAVRADGKREGLEEAEAEIATTAEFNHAWYDSNSDEYEGFKEGWYRAISAFRAAAIRARVEGESSRLTEVDTTKYPELFTGDSAATLAARWGKSGPVEPNPRPVRVRVDLGPGSSVTGFSIDYDDDVTTLAVVTAQNFVSSGTYEIPLEREDS